MTDAKTPYPSHEPTIAQRALIGLARGTPLGRGKAGHLIRNLLLRLGPAAIDYNAFGAKARLHIDDNPCEWKALINGRYNGVERRFLSEGLEGGGTFVDVGANVGLFTLAIAAAHGPSVKILAIEPHPIARGRLERNLAANGFSHVTVAPVACGAEDGELRVATDHVNLGASRVGEAGDVVVKVRPLQAVVEEAKLKSIDALKIDVEGYEDQVLPPFLQTAPRSLWPRRVVIEDVHEMPGRSCVDQMLAVGYQMKGKTRSNRLLQLPPARLP
jgi:FkbM family methyltransferase